MAVHKVEIEWHDLIEDPSDLPEDYAPCLVTLFDPAYKSYIHAERHGWYDSEKNVWEIFESLYGDEDDEFVPKRIAPGFESNRIQVIAWAPQPLIFVPEANMLLVSKNLG